MSAFDDALSRGWEVVYALEIEGLPYTFCESIPTRYDHYLDIAQKTVGGITLANVDALMIRDNIAMSQEIDRKSGIAGGRSIDFYLNYDKMGSTLSSIFRTPYYSAEITANLDYNDSAASVDDNTGFASSGSFYLGKEYIRYSGKSSSTGFTGLTRGEINEKYNFFSTSFSSYRFVTDTPLIWRGRKVTLFEHLVTPDGYILSSTWCDTSASTTREMWKGFIDSVPIPDGVGMRLKCMPYQRALAKEIGYSTTFDMALHRTDSLGYEQKFYSQEIVSLSFGDELEMLCRYEYPDVAGFKIASTSFDVFGEISGSHTSPTLMSRDQAAIYVDEALSEFETQPFVGDIVHNEWTKEGYEIGFTKISSYEVISLSFSVPNQMFLFAPGTYYASEWMKDGDVYGYKFFLPWRGHSTAFAPVLLHNIEGEGWQDTELQPSGLAIIDADGQHEVVEFLSKPDTTVIGLPYEAADLSVVVLTQRGIGNTSIINLFNIDGGTFKVGSGASGDLKTVLLSLIESSGTGERGTYDTLSTGFGFGISSDDVDESSFTEPTLGLSDEEATCVADGANNLDSLLGGWIAVQGRAIVCRLDTYDYGSGNLQKIMVADWHVIRDDKAVTITGDDVIIGPSISPKMLSGPNSVELETAHLDSGSPSVVVRDIPRIQSEGPRSQTFSMPSVPIQMAGLYGASYSYHSDGLSSIKLELGSHITLDIGDNAILSLSHPSMFDWESGSNSPDTVFAKVVGVETHLTTRAKTYTFLMAGNVPETLYLCPSAVVTSKADNRNIGLTSGHGVHFIKDTKVMIYNRGGEADGKSAEYLLDSTYVDGADALVFDSSTTLDTWVNAGSIVTHPTYGSTEAEHNQNFAFVKYDRRWTG